MTKHNRFDILTDINLRLIDNDNNLLDYHRFINEKEESLFDEYGKIDSKDLANYMKYDCNLIEINGVNCNLNKNGFHILELGGWLKYLELKLSEEAEQSKKEAERQEKKDQVLDMDLEMKKFDKKFTKKAAIIGLIILILNFGVTVLTIDFKEKNSQKSEEKTEPQLKEIKEIIEVESDTLIGSS